MSTANSSLHILRRVLRQAAEWNLLQAVPKIKMLPGERHRERVLTFEQEARYLAVGFGLLVRIQRSNTVVATRRLESVFPHTDDKGLQFVIRRLGLSSQANDSRYHWIVRGQTLLMN